MFSCTLFIDMLLAFTGARNENETAFNKLILRIITRNNLKMGTRPLNCISIRSFYCRKISLENIIQAKECQFSHY